MILAVSAGDTAGAVTKGLGSLRSQAVRLEVLPGWGQVLDLPGTLTPGGVRAPVLSGTSESKSLPRTYNWGLVELGICSELPCSNLSLSDGPNTNASAICFSLSQFSQSTVRIEPMSDSTAELERKRI